MNQLSCKSLSFLSPAVSFVHSKSNQQVSSALSKYSWNKYSKLLRFLCNCPPALRMSGLTRKKLFGPIFGIFSLIYRIIELEWSSKQLISARAKGFTNITISEHSDRKVLLKLNIPGASSVFSGFAVALNWVLFLKSGSLPSISRFSLLILSIIPLNSSSRSICSVKGAPCSFGNPGKKDDWNWGLFRQWRHDFFCVFPRQ